jgi:hypothetical protein
MVVELPIHMSPFPYSKSKESHKRHINWLGSSHRTIPQPQISKPKKPFNKKPLKFLS